MTTLQSIVNMWLELGSDAEPRVSIDNVYNRAFKLPRPRIADLHVSFHLEYVYNGRSPTGDIRCYVLDEDEEPVIDADGMPIIGYGRDTAGTLADAVGRLVPAIDAFVDDIESAYHMSDEAMRATHPREL